ncbi:PREDICTED: phospholipase A1-IIgamma-like [Ipomoea nil]|uniref:phospholipase A1-IIgamma-like n=1 Tax=Ipomoea nil TaxID=35883 RepID=UPI0009015A0C|nr:PREDICTED: phospholipase A1-IIgamma-like [Ipomoea nil]
MSDTGIAERWKELSGSENWKDLLEPNLDSDLRRYLIHYGTMIEPAGDAFINEPASKNVGLPRYARKTLFENTGLVKGNPLTYEVTKYFYAPSLLKLEFGALEYTLAESNWIGYVAVATNEGKVGLGRRDILVVWRGTIRPLEWVDNFIFLFVNAPLIFGQNSDPLVHMGWYYMYTTAIQGSKLNATSARDQVREEVARLVEFYKDEEISITVTGHSLGSSLATLNATDMAVNPFRPDIPVTAFLYASPKVGDENFKKAFSNQQNLRALRISDPNDPVPKVPPIGWKVGETIDSKIDYADVGVGLVIESKNSYYLKPEDDLSYHDLMLYLHGIDLYLTDQRTYERQGDFDLAKVNKYQGALKDEYMNENHIPIAWFNIKDKGMVQQEDGKYRLDDHEPDDDKVF